MVIEGLTKPVREFYLEEIIARCYEHIHTIGSIKHKSYNKNDTGNNKETKLLKSHNKIPRAKQNILDHLNVILY